MLRVRPPIPYRSADIDRYPSGKFLRGIKFRVFREYIEHAKVKNEKIWRTRSTRTYTQKNVLIELRQLCLHPNKYPNTSQNSSNGHFQLFAKEFVLQGPVIS